MEDLSLPQTKINELTEVFSKVGLDPNQFIWEPIDYYERNDLGLVPTTVQCTRIKHKEKNYYFNFNTLTGKFYSPEYRLGIKKTIENPENIYWDKVFRSFEAWLKNLNNELRQPDLWAELLKSRITMSIGFNIPQFNDEQDKPLSDEQQERFSNRLDDIEKQLSGILAGQENIESKLSDIKAEFNFLKRESKKSNIGVLKRLIRDIAIQITIKCATDKTIQDQMLSAFIAVLNSLPNFNQLPL